MLPKGLIYGKQARVLSETPLLSAMSISLVLCEMVTILAGSGFCSISALRVSRATAFTFTESSYNTRVLTKNQRCSSLPLSSNLIHVVIEDASRIFLESSHA